jgi:hypothetical protein
MVWEKGKLKSASIYSAKGGSTEIFYGSKKRKVVLKKNNRMNWVF